MARRSGLGKGLGAFIPTEVVGDRSSALREVPDRQYQAQPTAAPLALRRGGHVLAGLFDQGARGPPARAGTTEGGEVDEFELIAGERRWRAARRAGLQTIPVLVQASPTRTASSRHWWRTCTARTSTPSRRPAAYQQLVDEFGYTHERWPPGWARAGPRSPTPCGLLQIAVRRPAAPGRGPDQPGHARALLGTPDRGYQEELAKSIVAEGLTVRAVEEAVRARLGGPKPGRRARTAAPGLRSRPCRPLRRRATDRPPPRPAASRRRACSSLRSSLSNHLNTRVKVDMAAKRGKVVVDFATLEDLERIYKFMVVGPCRRPSSQNRRCYVGGDLQKSPISKLDDHSHVVQRYLTRR